MYVCCVCNPQTRFSAKCMSFSWKDMVKMSQDTCFERENVEKQNDCVSTLYIKLFSLFMGFSNCNAGFFFINDVMDFLTVYYSCRILTGWQTIQVHSRMEYLHPYLSRSLKTTVGISWRLSACPYSICVCLCSICQYQTSTYSGHNVIAIKKKTFFERIL